MAYSIDIDPEARDKLARITDEVAHFSNAGGRLEHPEVVDMLTRPAETYCMLAGIIVTATIEDFDHNEAYERYGIDGMWYLNVLNEIYVTWPGEYEDLYVDHPELLAAVTEINAFE